MNDVITFSRSIKYITTDDNTKADLPKWCSKRISYYEYNKIESRLYIRCKDCEKLFPVLKLANNNGDYLWKDVHDEKVYHYASETSGYDPICLKCKEDKRLKEQQEKLKIQTASTFRKKGNVQKQVKEDGDKKKGYTIFLSNENKLYVRLRKALNGDEISTFINSLIDEARKANPLKVIDKDGNEVKIQDNTASDEEAKRNAVQS